MRLLMGAKPMGYGSVAKLTTIAGLVPEHERRFVGEDLTLEFARRNSEVFTSVEECRIESFDAVRPAIEDADCVVSARNPELALWAARLGRPCVFVDSLLGFWRLGRSLGELVAIGRDVPAAAARMQDCSPHERVVVGHVLATHSIAQRCAGVDERVAELRALGCEHVEPCGPIVDRERLRAAARALPAADGTSEMVLGLGGFENFLLGADHNNAYLALIERWVRDFLAENPDCRQILVCCGVYRRPRTFELDGRRALFTVLPHDELVAAVGRARLYLCAPGLTAIHEALALGRVPLLLPEEHYGHVVNVRAFAGTLLGELAVTLADVVDDYAPPDDDLEGTRAAVACAAAIARGDGVYARFRRLLDERTARLAALGADAVAAAVDEAQRVADGAPFAGALSSALAAVEAGR